MYFRKVIKKEHSDRFKEKIYPSHFNINKTENSKLCWFHAVSIGELNSILPIIEEINTKYNNFEFLITTTTLSSANLIDKRLKNLNNIKHRFFPVDVNFLVSKFLDSWKPNVIFFVDSEIWPNLTQQIKKRKIPLALINARITAKSFKKWNFFPKTAKKIFSVIDLCLTANLETKKYLEQFEVKNIYHHGNIKLLSKIDEKEIETLNKEFLRNNRFWFAASTHRGEEQLCINTHIKLKEKFRKIVTVIAPRHIERTREIKSLCDNLNLNTQILNDKDIIQNNMDIIIVNSFGVLNNFYKYAKSVFIGKSTLEKLKEVGGQNPIDAAKLGCKIYHGPYIYNFKEIYEILEKKNISKKINNFGELSYNLINDLEVNEKRNNISEFIENLSQKTFLETMKNIDKFLIDEIR
tara:strand:- start:5866 stop:7089 length:1224 start_codon:yes stop_codon:yes gene_type:complete